MRIHSYIFHCVATAPAWRLAVATTAFASQFLMADRGGNASRSYFRMYWPVGLTT